jgi:hypothetical protein
VFNHSFAPAGSGVPGIGLIAATESGSVFLSGFEIGMTSADRATVIGRFDSLGVAEAGFEQRGGQGEAVRIAPGPGNGIYVAGMTRWFSEPLEDEPLILLDGAGNLDGNFQLDTVAAGGSFAVNSICVDATGRLLLGAVYDDGSGAVLRFHGGAPAAAPPEIALDPVSCSALELERVELAVATRGSAPLSIQWHRNGAPLPAETESRLVIASAAFADAGGYHVVVSNALGSAVSAVAEVSVRSPGPGDVDLSFDAGLKPFSRISCLNLLTNGNVLVSGSLAANDETWSGQIAELLPDGSRAWSYADPMANTECPPVYGACQVSRDGFVFVEREHLDLEGSFEYDVVRLTSTGTFSGTLSIGFGLFSTLELALTGGGAILSDPGEVRKLLPNGASDPSFSDPFWVEEYLAERADTALLVYGLPSGLTNHGIYALDATGALTGEPPQVLPSALQSVRIQGDGSILAQQLTGNDVHLLRFDATGAVLADILIPADVRDFDSRDEGRFFVGGSFETYNGEPRSGVARIRLDGSLDYSFDPLLGIRGDDPLQVDSVVAGPGSALYLSGSFLGFDGHLQRKLVRLHAGTNAPAPPTIDIAPADAVVSAGDPLRLRVVSRTEPGPVFRWQLGNRTLQAGTGAELFLPVSDFSDAGVYSVIVSNTQGVVTSMTVDVTVIADGYRAGTEAGGFAAQGITGEAYAVESDGCVLIGGGAILNRFDPSGILDGSFNPALAPSANITALLVDSNDSIVVAGNLVERLLPGGGDDLAFNPPAGFGDVTVAALLANGNYALGGNGFLRVLHPDGSEDTGFTPPGLAGNTVLAIAPLNANGMMVGASEGAGILDGRLFRMNSNGSADTSFDLLLTEPVQSVAVMPDGRVLASSRFGFVSVDGVALGRRANILRFHPDATLDKSFLFESFFADVQAMVVQSDGRIMIGGSDRLALPLSGARFGLARLLPDGRVDEDLPPLLAKSAEVKALLPDPDGIRMLVAGSLRFFDPARPDSELLWLMSEDVEAYSFQDQVFIYTLRTVPGRTYGVECTPVLAPPAWSPCHALDGDGGVHQFRDPLSLPARHYRFGVTRSF